MSAFRSIDAVHQYRLVKSSSHYHLLKPFELGLDKSFDCLSNATLSTLLLWRVSSKLELQNQRGPFPGIFAPEDWQEASEDLKARKAKLKRLAGFERECYEMDLRRLEGLVGPTEMKAVKTMCNFVDLAGQICAMDDFTPKIEKPWYVLVRHRMKLMIHDTDDIHDTDIHQSFSIQLSCVFNSA